jgi:hypothetical protein
VGPGSASHLRRATQHLGDLAVIKLDQDGPRIRVARSSQNETAGYLDKCDGVQVFGVDEADEYA